jgi:hypothetical protein
MVLHGSVCGQQVEVKCDWMKRRNSMLLTRNDHVIEENVAWNVLIALWLGQEVKE